MFAQCSSQFRGTLTAWTTTSLLGISVGFIGCQPSTAPPAQTQTTTHSGATSTTAASPVDEIQQALSLLDPTDRVLADQQKFCAVATESPLGSMGKPVKVMVDGEAVFLCCAGCKEHALEKPAETLAAVAKLKTANAPKTTDGPSATESSATESTPTAAPEPSAPATEATTPAPSDEAK